MHRHHDIARMLPAVPGRRLADDGRDRLSMISFGAPHTAPIRERPQRSSALRIFVSDWFEKLTFCPWWYVPLWAIPCAAYLIASGAKAAGLTVGQAAALTVAGAS